MYLSIVESDFGHLSGPKCKYFSFALVKRTLRREGLFGDPLYTVKGKLVFFPQRRAKLPMVRLEPTTILSLYTRTNLPPPPPHTHIHTHTHTHTTHNLVTYNCRSTAMATGSLHCPGCHGYLCHRFSKTGKN